MTDEIMNNHLKREYKSDVLGMKKINFTVDSALLRELGERLVGKPHIALGELVKNSYDADATKVIVRFAHDQIEVIDNGHGMEFKEFQKFWMRIGSTHKQEHRFSRGFGRPMTGSKGIGRLAVQFLSHKLEMHTTSDIQKETELEVHVNWDDAVTAGELTKAEAHYKFIPRITSFSEGSEHGTTITLSKLNHEWTSREVVELAKEIWWLQPPFRSNPRLRNENQKTFTIELESFDKEAVRKFDEQLRVIQDIWTARLLGKLKQENQKGNDSIVQLILEFRHGERFEIEYSVNGCYLNALQFEIRIYNLIYRQPGGIRVDIAREYFNDFGGVYVYDAGFRLPHYGGAINDWLGIEITHSHRVSLSQLLPPELQVPDGMTFLPTNSRIFGVVHVDTGFEQHEYESKETEKLGSKGKAGDYLKISVTRDRLIENNAYRSLVSLVRWALDYYAVQEAKRQFESIRAQASIEKPIEKFESIERILELHRGSIPTPVFDDLSIQVREAIHASEIAASITRQQAGLLGSLATAGMAALAYEHEIQKQYSLLESMADELSSIERTNTKIGHRLRDIVAQLRTWVKQARETRQLFSSLLDEESRETRTRFKARQLIDSVKDQLGILIRGVEVNTIGVDSSLRLPEARYVEWSAIFQNVFTNAVNALLDSPVRKINVVSRTNGYNRIVLILDTGVGVDLSNADQLFEPFERRMKISPERKALGAGGTGLGLTIVRMIASELGCKVAFVPPEEGYSTAFQISWREKT